MSILCLTGEEYESGEEEEEEMQQLQPVVEASNNASVVDGGSGQIQAALLQSGTVAMATVSHSGIDAMEAVTTNIVNQNVRVKCFMIPVDISVIH